MLDFLIGIDQHLFLLINYLPHPPSLVFFAQILSGVEEWGLVWLVIAAVLIYKEKHHPKLLVDLIVALVLASYLAIGVFKEIFGRLRPEFWSKAINVYIYSNDYFSFPSSHAAVAFAGAVVLAKIFPKGKWFLYTLATLIALSRVYLGVHYPFDVVGGMILGMIVGRVINYISSNPSISEKTVKPPRAWPECLPAGRQGLPRSEAVKITLILLTFFLLLFPQNASAKTILEISPSNMDIYQEEQILGVASDEVSPESNPRTSLNFVQKIINVASEGKKLVVGIAGGANLGNQEVDEVLLSSPAGKQVKLSLENGQLMIKEKFTQAITTLPLIIKQEAGELLAQTPSGAKLISYTPQDAISEIEKATGVDISKIPVTLELKDEGVRLVYEFKERKDKKLFGLIPITADITTTVSAQTGEVNQKSSSWIYQLLKNLLV